MTFVDNSVNTPINAHEMMMRQRQAMSLLGSMPKLVDAHIGGGQFSWRGDSFSEPTWRPYEGYAFDQNRNGRYDRGRDGVLVYDTNRDGRFDRKDVQSTSDMIKAHTPISGLPRLWIDRNRNGTIQNNELRSIFDLPKSWGPAPAPGSAWTSNNVIGYQSHQ